MAWIVLRGLHRHGLGRRRGEIGVAFPTFPRPAALAETPSTSTAASCPELLFPFLGTRCLGSIAYPEEILQADVKPLICRRFGNPRVRIDSPLLPL